jgi:Type ISP C-terminal specificity domain
MRSQATWTNLTKMIANAQAISEAKLSFVFSQRIATRLNRFSLPISCSTFAAARKAFAASACAVLSCSIATPTKRGGTAMTEADRLLTAGWGHAGKGGAVMLGRGRIVPRDYAPAEAAAQTEAALLGARTNDVFLNEDAYWRNIPETVWSFTIGGYQVLKKFLSYREQPLLGRALTTVEVRYVRDVARRLAAPRLMAPALDANYRACAAAHFPFGV